MKEYEKQKIQPDPAKLATQHRSNLRRQYVALLREVVKQLPHHVNTLSKRNRFATQVTRDPPANTPNATSSSCHATCTPYTAYHQP